MAAGTVYNFPMIVTCFSSSAYKKPQPNLSLRFNPPTIRASRSRICVAPIVARRLPCRALTVHGLLDDDDDDPVTVPPLESHNSEPSGLFQNQCCPNPLLSLWMMWCNGIISAIIRAFSQQGLYFTPTAAQLSSLFERGKWMPYLRMQ
ncbi:uncharacterized protein LOC123911637 isoform X2 [Trifolium pratense]|uniref:uncharacterized protein LOC123911637 isoform X2 n=1 Tax=Trifolium pratense TaxID=57577 RepID=UPI001E6909DB|nr:uncharacterized protein LOC123911637 isoform X2 [Trifolium pratense]